MEQKSIGTEGFSLIEILTAIAIISVISLIVSPSFFNIIEKAKITICNNNVLQVERDYETYWMMEDKMHTDILFAEFLVRYGQNLCTEGGVL